MLIIYILGIFALVSLISKSLILITSGLWYLCINMGDYLNDNRIFKNKKRKNKRMSQNRELATEIIDEFEELLAKYDLKIPNKERQNSIEECCIYGTDYFYLEDTITELIGSKLKNYK